MTPPENDPVAVARALFAQAHAQAQASQFPRIEPLLRANGHLLALQQTPACQGDDPLAALMAGARHREGLRLYAGRGGPS